MHTKNKPTTFIDRLNIYSQLFILNLIDITSFGGVLLSENNKSIFSSVSMLFTFLSLLLAQLNYNFFTKIPVSICASPILEASSLLAKLCDSITDNASDNEVIINSLIAIAISTLLFGIISIVFSIFDVSHYLFLIPHSVITGLLSGVGVSLIMMSYKLLRVNELGKENLGIFYFWFIFFFCILLYFLEKKYSYNYLPLISAVIFTIGLFLIRKIFNLNDNNLIKYTIISAKVSLNDGLRTLHKNLSLKNIKFDLILQEYKKILSLTFFYLLHLPINLTSYSKVTKVKSNLKKEFRTQGISNIIGSIFAIPVYFVCCYSVMLAESGINSFYDGIALSLVYGLNYFLAGTVQSHVPVMGLAMFPILIGLSFCYSGIVNPLSDGNFVEFIIIWSITIAAGYDVPMFILFCLGLLAAFCYYLVSESYFKKCKEAFNSGFMEEFSRDYDYLKVDYLLFFINISKFKRELSKLKGDTIIIDLIGCGSFDMLGNEVFRDSLCADKKYFIIGSPYNFNTGPVSAMKNVILCNDYLHTSDKINEMLEK